MVGHACRPGRDSSRYHGWQGGSARLALLPTPRPRTQPARPTLEKTTWSLRMRTMKGRAGGSALGAWDAAPGSARKSKMGTGAWGDCWRQGGLVARFGLRQRMLGQRPPCCVAVHGRCCAGRRARSSPMCVCHTGTPVHTHCFRPSAAVRPSNNPPLPLPRRPKLVGPWVHALCIWPGESA